MTFFTHPLTTIHRAVDRFHGRLNNHEQGLRVKVRNHRDVLVLAEHLLDKGLRVTEVRETTLVVIT